MVCVATASLRHRQSVRITADPHHRQPASPQPTRIIANLRHFRSVARLKKASQEDIAAVVGPALAAKLVAALG